MSSSDQPFAFRPLIALAVLLAGTFIVTLDFFIVAVAIPSMQATLQAGDAAMQWVVAGYGLTFAVSLITSGRLGDMLGRRRMFGLGVFLFTAASLACGVAPGVEVLIAARVAQGLGAAAVTPQVLSMLNTLYAGPVRARAFAWYGLVLGGAATAGQLIGGGLIEGDLFGLGWRLCFLINLPVGIVILATLTRAVPYTPPGVASRLDLPATLLLSGGLLGVLWPLIEGRQSGWPASVWLTAAAAALLLMLLTAHQRARASRGRETLLPPGLFLERRFSLGLLAALAFYSTNASFYFVLAVYLQLGRGLDALAGGLAFSVLAAGFFVTSLLVPRLSQRWGGLVLPMGGMVLVVGHLLQWALLTQGEQPAPFAQLIPLLLVEGAGIGLIMAPLTAATLANAPTAYAGAASGVFGTTQWIGNSLGVALIGIPFYGALESGGYALTAYQDALAAGLLYLVGPTLLFLAVAVWLARRAQTPAGATAGVRSAGR